MALTITRRDRWIAAAVLPIAIAAAYWYGEARASLREKRELETRAAACPSLDDADALLARARARADRARAELEAAQAEPPAEGGRFSALPQAERTAGFALLLQRHGVRLLSCSAAEPADADDERLVALLQRAGVARPALVRVEADASWSAFAAFLDALSSAPSPVLIHSPGLAPATEARRPSRWKFTACL